jgi:hypothetical protein
VWIAGATPSVRAALEAHGVRAPEVGFAPDSATAVAEAHAMAG